MFWITAEKCVNTCASFWQPLLPYLFAEIRRKICHYLWAVCVSIAVWKIPTFCKACTRSRSIVLTKNVAGYLGPKLTKSPYVKCKKFPWHWSTVMFTVICKLKLRSVITVYWHCRRSYCHFYCCRYVMESSCQCREVL